MRHRKAGRKLNRNSSHRNAMFRNMVTSLFKHDRIRTTDAKAKVLRSWADHLVTLAKRGDLHARRQALAIIREKDVVHKLFAEAGERFGNVSGGYTRIVKIGRRPGDAAPISLIELVTPGDGKKKKKLVKKKATPAVEAPKIPETKPEPETPAQQPESKTAEAAPAPDQEAPEGVRAEETALAEDAVPETSSGESDETEKTVTAPEEGEKDVPPDLTAAPGDASESEPEGSPVEESKEVKKEIPPEK